MARKFGEFNESSAIHQTKVVVTINKPLADLFIHQTFFQVLKRVNLPNILPAKVSCYKVYMYTVV